MSYATITQTNLGLATLPPEAKAAKGKSHPDFGLGGLMKDRAPLPSLPAAFTAPTTIIMDFPEEEPPDLYQPLTTSKATIQVKIRNNGHPNLRGHVIRQIISDKQILLLNYGRADTWFFSADTFDVTQLHNTIKQHGPYTLSFQIYQKDKINGTIRWVPPAMSNETILKALRIVSKLEPSVTQVPYTSNRNFTIYSDTPSKIPHYIQIKYKNTAINLLIAIPGRRQACQTCGSSKHWTSQCHILDEELTQTHTTANAPTTIAPTETSATQPQEPAETTTLPDLTTTSTAATPASTTATSQQPETTTANVTNQPQTTATETTPPISATIEDHTPFSEPGSPNKHACRLCIQQFDTPEGALHHEDSKHEKYNRCVVCLDEISSTEIQLHHATLHDETSIYQCNYCTVTHTHLRGIAQHLRVYHLDQKMAYSLKYLIRTKERPYYALISQRKYEKLVNTMH